LKEIQISEAAANSEGQFH